MMKTIHIMIVFIHNLNASPIVPISINSSPITSFAFIFLLNMKYERTTATSTLNLSIAATAEVGPFCSAL